MKITQAAARKLALKYKIDLSVVPIDEFTFGLNVELEHGKMLSKLTNITNNSKDATCKIAIAHLLEDPRYYYYLKMMEAKREKYWAKREKPSIFLA